MGPAQQTSWLSGDQQAKMWKILDAHKQGEYDKRNGKNTWAILIKQQLIVASNFKQQFRQWLFLDTLPDISFSSGIILIWYSSTDIQILNVYKLPHQGLRGFIEPNWT